MASFAGSGQVVWTPSSRSELTKELATEQSTNSTTKLPPDCRSERGTSLRGLRCLDDTPRNDVILLRQINGTTRPEEV